jgi:probable F420-dependent oxidoreductase
MYSALAADWPTVEGFSCAAKRTTKLLMDIKKLGLWFFLDGMSAPQSAQFAKKTEKLGYGALWIPEAVGRDPFAHSAYLLNNTERLVLATGIANIYARDAIAMVAGANTVGELSGGRFLLGIGVSHAPLVTGFRGHDSSKPYSYMREYLSKMKSARYFGPKPKEEVPIVLAALHPKMLQLSATEARGTHTYFVPPEHTAKARAAIGPNAWICAAQAIVLETDAAKARKAAREYMKTYVPRLPNYTNNLKALGWADAEFADGCSDRLVDAIVAWGTESKIRDRIDAHLKAGANHVCILPLSADNPAMLDERAMEALAPK